MITPKHTVFGFDAELNRDDDCTALLQEEVVSYARLGSEITFFSSLRTLSLKKENEQKQGNNIKPPWLHDWYI